MKSLYFCFTGTHTGRIAMAESTGTHTSAHAQPMFTRTENRAGFYIRERTGSWAFERLQGPRASLTHQNSMEVILTLTNREKLFCFILGPKDENCRYHSHYSELKQSYDFFPKLHEKRNKNIRCLVLSLSSKARFLLLCFFIYF